MAKTLTDAEKKKSMDAFKALGLSEQLADAAASLGWKEPSIIQQQAVPHLLQGTPITFAYASDIHYKPETRHMHYPAPL